MRLTKFAALTLVVAIAGCAANDQSPDARISYISSRYGFSFTVPAALRIKEYAPESLSIGQSGLEDAFESAVDVRLYTAGRDVGYDSFDAFALETLRNMCAADGPRITVYCTVPQQRQPFETKHGVKGEVLYLERVYETIGLGEKTKDGFGPIFLFDISDAIGGAAFSALAFQPPANLAASEVDSALLRQVASTLSLGSRSG